MSGRSDPNGAPACADPARELLDFHVNGSLEGAEAAMVAAHVAACRDCAREVRELSSLAGAIERHGTALAPGSGRRWSRWSWVGVAAALLAVALLLPWRRGGADHGISSPDDSQIRLDLGTGPLREAGSAPVALLTPSAVSLRLTLFPPTRTGASWKFVVRGADGRPVLDETSLAPPDAMGRSALTIPASRLRTPGTYRVELRDAAAAGSIREFTYPFEVRTSADSPTTQPSPAPSD